MRRVTSTGYWSAGPPGRARRGASLGGRAARVTTRSGRPRPTAPTPSRRCAWWGSQHSTHPARHRRSCSSPPARPAATAMAAITLDHLSDGRFVLGLGVVGPAGGGGLVRPAVPEAAGPHPRVRRDRAPDAGPRGAGRRSTASSTTCRCRTGGTGLGKPLKSTVHPLRADLPIYLGAEGPRTSPSPPRSPTAGCRCSSRPTDGRASTRDALAEGFAAARRRAQHRRGLRGRRPSPS